MKVAVLVVGILGILLGLIIGIGSLALPSMTRNVSSNEAMFGVIAGVVVFVISLFIALIGLVLVLKKKKK
jgi:uncharacterized membrane protein